MNISSPTKHRHYTGHKRHAPYAAKCSLTRAYLLGKLGETVFTKHEACLVGQTENLLQRHYQIESDEIII